MTIEESYATLGINKNANRAEIDKAYKQLIKLYHPDTYKGDKNFACEKTIKIIKAHNILTLKERASTNVNNNEKFNKENISKNQSSKQKSEFSQNKKTKCQNQDKQSITQKSHKKVNNKQNVNPTKADKKPKLPIRSIDSDYIAVAVLVLLLIVLIIVFANL